MLPGTSYKSSVTFSINGTGINPALSSISLFSYYVSDSSIQISVNFYVILGMGIIEITSGTYSTQVPASWNTTSDNTVAVVRNQRGSFYTLVLNGTPLITFPISSANGAPTIAAGSAVVFGPNYDVSLFKLRGISITASSTIFTSAWNFIHGLNSTFVGSTTLTRDSIRTKRGPLVRGWGDDTPATKEDVVVRVNGVPVVIAGVNPYIGEIYVLNPIPLAAAGTFTCDVDYIWFVNPAMEMAGLNTLGLTLNTWDRAPEYSDNNTLYPASYSDGVVKTNRFPMGVVLGPYKRPTPVQVGHKYIGFQKGGYSALLNQPTTFLLNQNPHAISSGQISAIAVRSSGSFNGQVLPTSAPTPWTLDGVDSGGLVGNGTYKIIDDSSGPYGIGTAAFYKREVDLSLDTKVTSIARFKIQSYTADGVFTGVGVGVHDGAHLVFVGALEVSGVEHVGLLLDATKSHLEEGWSIGPSAEATATSQNSIVISYESLPSGIRSGSRFRISGGSQSGVYTISECGLELGLDGVYVTIDFTGDLPTSINDFGAGTFVILFETPWQNDLISIRLYSSFPGGEATAYLGGGVSGKITSISEVPAYPAQTALLLPATQKGVAFWGSVSRRAVSASIWDITQYASDPSLLVRTVQGILTTTDMTVLPQDETTDPWYIVGGFGESSVSSGELLLKSTSGSDTIPISFTYERVEPYLTNKVFTDITSIFRIDSGILGAGDAAIRIKDTYKEATLKNLLYVERSTDRILVPIRPNVSLTGLQSPEDAGWYSYPTNTAPSPFVRGQVLIFSKSTSQTSEYEKESQYGTVVDDEGLILEARLQIDSSYTVGTDGIGFFFGGDCAIPSTTNERTVIITFSSGVVELRNRSYVVIQTFAFNWDDEAFHSYRLLCDPIADIAVLTIDDNVVGSVQFSLFSSASTTVYLSGRVGLIGDGVCTVTLDSFSSTPLRVIPKTLGDTIGRTFGILLDNEYSQDDIDSYRIPRTDGTNTLNSSLLSTVVDMDWRSDCQVRMYLDPNWGVSVYRPDLPPPPYFSGNYVTETTDPSAAWINVEYSVLPVQITERGSVAFGSIDSRSISQQRWGDVTYRIRGAIDGFGLAPQNMVLNRAFTLTSGEYNLDSTPETATVVSRSPYLVYVPDCAIFADRVFVVQVDGVVVPSTEYTFDKLTQNIQFVSSAALPSDQHPVTVTFAVGAPTTKEYLCGQPLLETVTVLNSDTPPVPKSRDEFPARVVPIDPTSNEPVTFVDGPDTIYAGVEFCETKEGENVYISSICDGPGPGLGLSEVSLDGHFTTDVSVAPEGPAGPWKGSPSIAGSNARFSQSTILTASGGFVLNGGKLGPGTAVLYPNQRGPNRKPVPSRMGINQDFSISVRDTTPRVENLDVLSLLGDNTPPFYADASVSPNPDGLPTVNGNGGVAYMMVDYASTNVSRLGPWGGLSSLTNNSIIAGGGQLTGNEFTLNGGQQIPRPVVVTGYIRSAN
jgi:hypothetical protein